MKKQNVVKVENGALLLQREETLQSSIDEVYNAFSDYREKIEVNKVTEHQRTKTDELLSESLSELTPESLKVYHKSAITSWGDSALYRCFLPRLLELSAFPMSYFDLLHEIDIRTICSKLTYAEWRSWPDQEQNAIYEYLKQFWMTILASPITVKDTKGDPAELWKHYNYSNPGLEFLSELGGITDNLKVFLDLWVDDPSFTSLIRYVQSVLKYCRAEEAGLVVTRWPQLSDSQYEQINLWLSQDVMKNKVEEACLMCDNKAVEELFSEAHKLLTSGRK